jgi:hypothetical protein
MVSGRFKDEKAYYDASGQEAQPELVSVIASSSDGG